MCVCVCFGKGMGIQDHMCIFSGHLLPPFFFLGGKGSNLYCDRLLCVLVALRFYVLKYVLAHLSCSGQSKVSFPAVKN